MRRWLAPLALVALPTLAQEVAPRSRGPEPVIRAVKLNGRETSEAPLGAVLIVEGQHLHSCRPGERGEPCRHEVVRVRIGEVDARVLAATPERVTVLLPLYLWITDRGLQLEGASARLAEEDLLRWRCGAPAGGG